MSAGTIYQATVSAPVNIAVIKYWGKRDTSLILPTNDSLSVTLDQDHLRSVTTARADESFGRVETGAQSGVDRLWLNGEEEVIKEGGRLRRCIDEMRKIRKEKEAADSSLPKVSMLCNGIELCALHRQQHDLLVAACRKPGEGQVSTMMSPKASQCRKRRHLSSYAKVEEEGPALQAAYAHSGFCSDSTALRVGLAHLL